VTRSGHDPRRNGRGPVVRPRGSCRSRTDLLFDPGFGSRDANFDGARPGTPCVPVLTAVRGPGSSGPGPGGGPGCSRSSRTVAVSPGSTVTTFLSLRLTNSLKL